MAECDAADVDLAVAAARRAFSDGRWPHVAPGDRKAVMSQLADLIRATLEEMALLDSLNLGKLLLKPAAQPPLAALRRAELVAEAGGRWREGCSG